MSNIFNSIRVRRPKRHKFNLSHEVKLTCNMGDIIPVNWYEVIPGDSFKERTEALVRTQALLAPLMHRIDVYFHHFFVPNRLIWDDFEKFITGGEDGTFTTKPPTLLFRNAYGQNSDVAELWASVLRNGSLADYLGVPTIPDRVKHSAGNTSANYLPAYFSKNMEVSALPFRAYTLIYNEWYRDQNLQEPIQFSKASGDERSFSGNTAATINPILVLRKRNWHKDYFTSALPWTQRGGDVHLPLTGTADVEYVNTPGVPTVMRNANTGAPLNISGSPQSVSVGDGSDIYVGSTYPVDVDNSANLQVNMDSITSTTVNELRRSIKIQEWLEKNARGGARYIEQILSHFGVMGKDSRLQRPQYLGGSKSPVTISEVIQNSATGSGDTPQGNLAGKGLSVNYNNGYKRFFDEHGIVMTLMTIMPKANYQQGLPRKFQRRDKFDYYFPEFAHLGEQPIFKSELFYDFTKTTAEQQDSQSSENAVPFGYTPRYAEYKTALNRVHGQFKESLSFWHMGRIFANQPGLNSEFITMDAQNSGLNRVFATEGVTDVNGKEFDKFEVQIWCDVRAKRPMPVYGTPMI